MKKDKITIAYILITITIIIFASIYFIKLDFKENNTNIKKGATQAFNTGKVYSVKMYTMLNGYATNLIDGESNNTDVKTPVATVSKMNVKPVLTNRVNKTKIKTLPISKLKVSNKVKRTEKKPITTGKLNIGNNTKKQPIKETL